MRTVLIYFRQHPWQRRVLTGLLAVILGISAALAILPTLRDRRIVDLLGSEDPIRRQRGIDRAVSIAPDRPEIVDLIERRLDSADDRQFCAMVQVLSQLRLFHVPRRRGRQLDRFRAVNFATAAAGREGAEVRRILLHGIILDGRDNAHVRKVMELAAGDPTAGIRCDSAVLAARLGDDQTLLRLMGDADETVRAAAAMDAALAGRTSLVGDIAEAQKTAAGDMEQAALTYALARLGRDKYSREIVAAINRAAAARKRELLDLTLCAAPLLKDESAGKAVMDVLRRAGRERTLPPAMALIAAGRMKLVQARPFVAGAINDLLARRADLTVGDSVVLAAAVNAAGRLGMQPRLFVQVMERLWHPGTSLAMILSAEALAKLAADFQADKASGIEDRDRALAVLDSGANRPDTPVPAAAAAVAMFNLAPGRAGESLRSACAAGTPLAGDYVAWGLSLAPDRSRAWRIAGAFLARDVYDKRVRSCGAALLALLARNTDWAEQARRTIEDKLKGLPADDPFTAGSYRCALLVLGARQYAGDVAALARSDAFPKRRALTALVLAGEADGFDYVFARTTFQPEWIDSFLAGRLMSGVYAAAASRFDSHTASRMPAFDIDAPAHVRYWQGRLMRDFYLIHRRSILRLTDGSP